MACLLNHVGPAIYSTSILLILVDSQEDVPALFLDSSTSHLMTFLLKYRSRRPRRATSLLASFLWNCEDNLGHLPNAHIAHILGIESLSSRPECELLFLQSQTSLSLEVTGVGLKTFVTSSKFCQAQYTSDAA